MKINKVLFFFISSIFILIVILVCAELIVRLAGLGSPILYNTNLSYRYYPKPNQHVNRMNNIITINNLSLRSDEDWVNSSSKKKILFMGDSVTYGGSSVGNKDLFSSIICEKFNNIKKKYLCGNGAVNGYGADNIRNRIVYDDIDNENIIVVTLIGDSGFRSLVNIGSTPSHNEMPKYFPGLKEFTYYVLWRTMFNLRKNDWWFEGNRHDKNYIVAKKSLEDLRDVLYEEKNKNKRIIVVLHPNKEQFDKNSNPNKKNLDIKYNLLKKVYLGDKKLEILDMKNIIKNINLNEIFYDDVHLSQKGHQLFANEIYKLISYREKN
jgi:lysophospholipase L1-like esterase